MQRYCLGYLPTAIPTLNLKTLPTNSNEEETNELDYDEDKDQLEEEHEEESAETTVNQVFWNDLLIWYKQHLAVQGY